LGSAAIEDERIVRWDFCHPTPADDALLGSPDNTPAGSGAGAPDQINFEGHRRQIEDMVLSLRNETPLLIDGAQARNTVVLVRALYASAESGLPVKLSV
jgi:predicted dehydrogenase